ncbi:MAG TPA: SusC/RagA family TonB-linked outer membrane protein [Fodinibius sp.]|nr:SusC/RagA family TonB-linked outer membrane protein [Fodinibius sp.]
MRAETVTGTVTDAQSGQSMPGVNILVKGTAIGTSTDQYGDFELEVPSLQDTLAVSFIGYQSQEVPIDGQTEIDIQMIPEAIMGEEMVVVGYGVLGQEEVTSAITHVDSEDLLTVSSSNPIMSLQGKVAGLTISNTGLGDPNSGTSIQLRGVSSRDAGLNPLVVINGMPGGSLENINQNDIESIDVLKGGAASAIYGTRGSNGVIVVTTKKGSDQSRAAYNGRTTFNFRRNYVKPLSAGEYLEQGRGDDVGTRTNWLDAVTRDFGFSHKHTLSVSGGGSNTTYRATIDYRNANGLDLRSQRKEYGARLTINHTSDNDLYSVNLNIAPRRSFRKNADWDAFSTALTLNPTIPIQNQEDPSRYYNIRSGYSSPYNPVERLETELSGTEARVLDWNGTATLNFLPNLNTQVTLGQSTSDYFDFFFRPSYSTYAINNEGGENSANRAYNKYVTNSLEWTGNYFLDINNHFFKGLVGYSYQYFVNSGISVANRDFPSDAFTYNNIGDGLYNQVEGRNGMDSYKNSSKLIAFLGRVNYSFDNKYLASASLRYEGSSKFGYDNKWGYFPAVSIGWRISDESFMEELSWINDLKLRADYGVTGNQDFGSYLSLDTYSGYGYYPLHGEYYQVWGPSQNTNYNLRWETSRNINIGMDFSFLEDRLSGSVNYYPRRNEDLLGDYSVPLPPNPQPTTYANVGTMKNSGFELQLSANVVNRQNLSYTVSLTGATNRNEFVSFSNDQYQGQDHIDVVGMPAPGSPGTAQRLEEGRRVGSFYMLKSAGVNDNGELLVYNSEGEMIPGDQASNEDKQYVGNGLPKFTASLGNTFNYKGWDASIYLRGGFGYDIFNTLAFYVGTPATQTGANVLETAYNGGKYSKLTANSTSAVLSDYFLEKGDFVKIDNVSIGYTFNFNDSIARSLRLYTSAINLATFTAFKGGDPDQIPINGLYPGIDASRSYYPSTTQILIGLNVDF